MCVRRLKNEEKCDDLEQSRRGRESGSQSSRLPVSTIGPQEWLCPEPCPKLDRHWEQVSPLTNQEVSIVLSVLADLRFGRPGALGMSDGVDPGAGVDDSDSVGGLYSLEQSQGKMDNEPRDHTV